MARGQGATDAPIERRAPQSALWLKPLLSPLADLAVSPLLLVYFVLAAVLRDRADEVFQGFSQLLSLVPGFPGNVLRRAFYRRTLLRCAPNCVIGFGTLFATREVEIGDHVYIGARCMIAHASIGDNVLIGSNVDLIAGKHQHHFHDLDTPIRLQGGRYERLSIGRDVWIGNGASVMESVGEQAIVAAAAVVVKPVPPRAIVGGNPARVIGHRGTESLTDNGAAVARA